MAYFNPTNGPYFSAEDHKVALITGGNAGIGFFSVLHLYLHGYIIYIAGRNEQKVAKAIDDIKSEAESRRKEEISKSEDEMVKRRSLGELHYIHLDLQHLKSVKEAAEEFMKHEKKLDLLIDNAAIMAVPFAMTDDGFEVQLQTNYISHVLFDETLMPLLEKGSDPRVVFVSSMGHNMCYKKFPPQDPLDKFPAFVFESVRYGRSKLYGIQYMKILALKYPKVLCLSLHPGVILGTGLYSYVESSAIGKYIFKLLNNFIGVTPEEGALSTLRASLDLSLRKEKDNGKYLTTGGPEGNVSALADDKEYAYEVYNWCLNELKARGYNYTSN